MRPASQTKPLRSSPGGDGAGGSYTASRATGIFAFLEARNHVADQNFGDGDASATHEQAEKPMPPRPDPYLSGPHATADGRVAESGSKLAPLSLGFALASFACLWGVGGLLAIGLGLAANREPRAGGARDAAMALAAVVLGTVNVLLTATLVALGVLFWGQSRLVPTPPAPTLAKQQGPLRELAPPRPVNKLVKNSRIGSLQLIDVEPGVPSLASELERQWLAANAAGERLLVWTIGPRCVPCDGVMRALPDPRMQMALAGVRILRIDATAFQQELGRLRLPSQALPGFALLGKSGHPIDYVHGGEWDEDIAPNIAPVLGKFVRGEYDARRYPWRGGARDDETAL